MGLGMGFGAVATIAENDILIFLGEYCTKGSNMNRINSCIGAGEMFEVVVTMGFVDWN